MDSGATSDQPAAEPAPYGPLPVGSGRRVWARRPADEAESKALASPLRLRILRLALHEPRTNKELADALDRDPASVLHHVRTLVDTGFLVEQEVRRGPRGSRERPYLASGKSFYVDTGDAQVDARDLLLETFLQEIATLPPSAIDGTRLGFRLNKADHDDVRRRLRALLDDIASMPSDPDGEPWSLYLAVHPEVRH
jgi:DNA-binding transcriptional ArsR family regulator